MINYSNQNVGVLKPEDAGYKLFGTSTRETKNVSRSHLLAAKCYAEEIKSVVTDETMMPNVNELVTNLLSEFEDVLISSERLLYHNIAVAKAYIPNTYRFILPDIMSAADQLMFAYATKSMSVFDYRNTQPYVIVQVRQIIENAAFSCIGVENVTTQTGRIASGAISETLTFLIDAQNAANYCIKLPIKPDLLLLLYRWACSFVHKGTLDKGYIIYFAYSLTKKLLEQPLAPIRIYDGSYKQTHEHGYIRIENYYQLKQDYINTLNPNNRRVIKWLPINNVGAYLVSL